MSIVLNQGQQDAIQAINAFISSPDERFMSLEGPPGTGKTTVIKYVIEQLDNYYKTRELLGIKERRRNMVFCATTNKACEAFEHAMGSINSIRTIHSHLNLILTQDHLFRDVLTDTNPDEVKENELIFIDECSYVDDDLWLFINKKIGKSCRVILMGDPAQLKQALCENMPAFESGFRKAELTQIMRQESEDNPIRKLSIRLREAIMTKSKTIPAAIIDGKHIRWLPRYEFDDVMLQDMSSDEWLHHTSKFIAYRNKTVQKYNKTLYNTIQKSTTLLPGDYALNNNYVKGNKDTGSIGTDRTVLIDQIVSGNEFNTPGHYVTLDGNAKRTFFMPDDHASIDRKFNSRIRKLQALADDDSVEREAVHKEINRIKNFWVDLRPVYACTVYKSQGSTYRRVFIDLTDLGTCRNVDQLMRMLLVGISRASHQVFLTGDLP